MTAVNDVDLLTPANIENPYPIYRVLREDDPVHWSDFVHGWLVTRYEDVQRGLQDPRFSANRTHLFAKHQLRGVDPSIIKDYVRLTSSMIVMKDGVDHSRLRAQEDHALCPAHIDRWSPIARRIMGELLDRVQNQRRMELVADISEPLPSLLLTEIFGIPASDRADFQRWAEDATAFFAVTPGDVETIARRANEGLVRLEHYISAIIAERRRKPGQDLVSLFIDREGRGNLTAEELVANSVHMLIVGHMTSIAQFSNGVYELLSHPESLKRVRTTPALLAAAVEEVIRYSPAVHFTHRIAMEDIEIRDRIIEKGQIVFFGLAAANRDPRVFSDPDTF